MCLSGDRVVYGYIQMFQVVDVAQSLQAMTHGGMYGPLL